MNAARRTMKDARMVVGGPASQGHAGNGRPFKHTEVRKRVQRDGVGHGQRARGSSQYVTAAGEE